MSNINIAGSGKITAGGEVYDSVRISGSGTIEGTLHCKSISTAGSGHICGDVYCEGKISTAGSSHFDGSVECYEMSTAGSSRVDKNVKCTLFKSAGSAHICGSIDGREVRIAGSGRIDGNVSGENVKIGGSATIGGLLNAEAIEIKLRGGTTKIDEIGCTKLEVYPEGESGGFVIFGKRFGGSISGSLECRTIEGDELWLSFTKAEVVRGNTVKIGPNCVIGRVEYGDSIEIDETANVKEQVRI